MKKEKNVQQNKHWSDLLPVVLVAVAIAINSTLQWGMIGGLVLGALGGGLGVLIAAMIKGEFPKKKDK